MRDLILAGGQVFDGHRHVGPAAVLVVDGRVAAVGDPGRLRERAPHAEVVDVAGSLVLPGFEDAHVHPLVGGLERLSCDLSGLSTREEYLDALGRYAREHPDVEWIRGGGWSLGAFEGQAPLAADLDRVVGDRPVFLPSNDHHDAWVSSRALEIAGVGPGTPDPRDGWVVRDADGRPTGTLREAAASLVHRHVVTGRAEGRAAMLVAQAVLHSSGITGWQDALLGGYAGLDDPTEAYCDLVAEGLLTARVRGALWWDRHRGAEQVAELVAVRDGLRARGVDAGAVKVMVDGIAETRTASVLEPYLGARGCPCGDHGLPFLDASALREAVVACDAAGLQLHFHAIGDRAVRDVLDALEHARGLHGENDLRHHVAHLQLVDPEDRPRFARLGVTANVQGLWADGTDPAAELVRPHLGDQRWSGQYPFGDIARSGAHLAGGSDWPVDSPDPMLAVHALVNRRGYRPTGNDGPRLGPEQALDLRTALAAYTSGSARVNHHDDSGRVVPGARADLVVLDRDPFAGPAEEVGAASVVQTYVAGGLVHAR